MPARGKRTKTARIRRFFAYLGGEAALDGRKAAELAGYARPDNKAAELRKIWPEEFERVETEFRAKLTVSWEETQELLAEMARNKKHKDQFKALETIAKLHGKLDPKLNIKLDRMTIEQHLEDLLLQMAANKQDLAAGPALLAESIAGNSQDHDETPPA